MLVRAAAAFTAVLSALVLAGSSLASAHSASPPSVAGRAPTGAFRPIVTPFGHAKPSGQKPYRPLATSPWTPLVNQPTFSPGTMLVLSDGTVLAQSNEGGGGTSSWWKLTPDSTGSYINGTWSQVASMPSGYAPLYFASAVLPDGRMIVEGGEYNGTDDGVWTNQGAIYDPVTNTWASVAPPAGWTSIGDAASDVLDNGTFMLQQPCQNCATTATLTTDDALLNASNLTWTVIPGTGKNDPNDEEGWTLEPSGQLLTLDVWSPPATELFTPSSETWSSAGDTATGGDPVDPSPVVEIGPQVEMPGGNTFVVGAGTSTQQAPTACTTDAPTDTALYDYTAGTWSAGPEIPAIGGQEFDSADGPGSILPDGNVLFDASACVYNTPTHFFLYDAGSNTLTQVADVPNAPNDSSYYTRMLALPTGQVLFDDGSNDMEVYTAGGTPDTAWEPTITSSPSTVLPGGTYSLSGTQLAGLSQGAAYGDDVQDNTNFPLVRITNDATGTVTYARTTNWSSVSVAPGTSSSTDFTLPSTTPVGPSTIEVDANGIVSPAEPTAVQASPSLSASAPTTGTTRAAIAASSINGVLSAGSSPTGTVSFRVFGPQSSPPSSCTSGGTAVGTTSASGDGTFHPPAGFTPTAAGDYWWYASYGGDTNNNSAASVCGAAMAETVVSPPPTVRLAGPPKVKGDSVTFKLSCVGAAGQSCQTTSSLMSVETLKGSHPVAVAASHKAKKHKRTVVFAHRSVTVVAGSSTTITFTLHAAGRKLLKRFGKLPVALRVTLTTNGKTTTAINHHLTIRKKKRTKRHAFILDLPSLRWF
jgi:hypothetical protein